ncbi:MAG TPA: UDP-2,3-diacylglucosamine diphosphatase [Phycisphaerae bacterium]|nr:UDP-2,3-diacylglucosamine diphosphatase [Phycisphaerales bacterium]HRX83822.1 UDP-2,3-diacylglucosamine diphosphatase [Phycisphaerae bacterium]
MSTFYRSVWISDLHLASPAAQPERVHSFLDQIKCDHLYLVGDIIDVWALRKKWHWPRQYNEVLHKLLKRSRKGAKVVYIPGNHDEFFRTFVGFTFGDIRVKARDVHTTADGKRLLVTHGDEFDAIVRHRRVFSLLCVGAHRQLLLVNRAVNFIRRCLGKPDWSLAAAVTRRVQDAVRHLANYESLLVAEARRYRMDGVVCGHSHRPALRRHADGVLYCNTGDWTDHCTALVEHPDGRLELVHWKDVIAAQSPPQTPRPPQKSTPRRNPRVRVPFGGPRAPVAASTSPE